MLPHTCVDGEVRVVRYGRLIDRKPSGRAGILYHDLGNTVRQQIPSNVRHVATKVTGISSRAVRPLITLATGEEIAPRIAIMATGLNPGLCEMLDIRREVLSPCHSIRIGFDIKAPDGKAFAFPALTVFPERPGQSMAYLTIFPVPGGMRANLFVYWGMDDARLRTFRLHSYMAQQRVDRGFRYRGILCRSGEGPMRSGVPAKGHVAAPRFNRYVGWLALLAGCAVLGRKRHSGACVISSV